MKTNIFQSRTILLLCAVFFLGTQLMCAQKSKTKTTSESTSISVSDSDDDYAFSASFNDHKTQKVKAAIVSVYGESQNSHWSPKGISISLQNGKLTMKMDKNKLSQEEKDKMKALGDKINAVLDAEVVVEKE
jgi:hypothetical protein